MKGANGGKRRPSLTRKLSSTVMSTVNTIRRRSSLSLKSKEQAIEEVSYTIDPVKAILPNNYKTTLYSWGRNDEGQLLLELENGGGSGKQDDDELEEQTIFKPIRNRNLEKKYRVTSISSGLYHTCIINDNGQVIGGGENDDGQLQPDRQNDFFTRKPKLLEMILQKQIAQVSCGLAHTAVITTEGIVLTFGQNEYGQLGHSFFSASSNKNKGNGNQDDDINVLDARTKIAPKIMDGEIRRQNAIQVACSESSTFVLTDRGQVYSCGMGARGILGLGSEEGVLVATNVKGCIMGVPIMQISAGSSHVVALSTSGRVYSWGDNRFGQCGKDIDKKNKHILEPVYLQLVESGNKDVDERRLVLSKKIIDEDDDSDEKQQISNEIINEELRIKIIHIACGGKHTCFLTDKNTLLVCGRSDKGALGLGDKHTKDTAPPVFLPNFNNILDVSCGDAHTIILQEGGIISEFGQLIDEETNDRVKVFSPRRVTGDLEKEQGIFSVKAGGQTSFALAVKDGKPQYGSVLSIAIKKRGIAIIKHVELKKLDKISNETNIKMNNFTLIKKELNQHFFFIESLNSSFLQPVSGRNGQNEINLLSKLNLDAIEKVLLKVTRCFLRLPNKPNQKYKSKETNTKQAIATRESNLQYLSNSLTHFFQLGLLKLAKELKMSCEKNKDYEISPDQLRLFLILLLNPMNEIVTEICLVELVVAINTLPTRALVTLEKWIKHDITSANIFVNRLVKPFLIVLDKKVARREFDYDALALCVVLKIFYNASISSQASKETLFPFDVYYLQQVDRWSQDELVKEYTKWRTMAVKSSQLSLFNFPFLISATSKRRVMQLEGQALQMNNVVYSALRGNANPFYFELLVRRDNLLPDTIDQLLRASPSQLKSPLRIKFLNEEGVDAGGLKKEYFQLISKQLFSGDYGMFVQNKLTKMLWFNINSMSDDMTEFLLIGLLIGLAVLQLNAVGCRVPKHFLPNANQSTVGVQHQRIDASGSKIGRRVGAFEGVQQGGRRGCVCTKL